MDTSDAMFFSVIRPVVLESYDTTHHRHSSFHTHRWYRPWNTYTLVIVKELSLSLRDIDLQHHQQLCPLISNPRHTRDTTDYQPPHTKNIVTWRYINILPVYNNKSWSINTTKIRPLIFIHYFNYKPHSQTLPIEHLYTNN